MSTLLGLFHRASIGRARPVLGQKLGWELVKTGQNDGAFYGEV